MTTKTLHEINKEDIDLALLKEIPLNFARANVVLPLRIKDERILVVASGQSGIFAAHDIARKYKLKLSLFSAAKGLILEAINKFYSATSSAKEVMGDISGEDLLSVATEFESPKDLLEIAQDAPIIRLLNALFQDAVKHRASDIHIEPYEETLDIRMRTDGIMHKILSPPKIIQDALISRIKIMADMDIAEKRLPQDGRIRLLVGGRDIDIRVSIIPTVYGERAVLRFLDRRQGMLGLYEVGLSKNDARQIESIVKQTHGMFLVTGPTGSGKTTTLYAVLNRIKNEKTNIMTVENPVEYDLKGVGQMQINPNIALTFASGLRSILRQDPDVIMVGEIRDLETAEVVIQASLTGHLVLSTLHTNNAASSIIRLLDLGVEPFLVSSSLLGVLAQRLVRKICPHCKIGYKPSEVELSYFASPPKQLYKGKGCDKCMKEGYAGRTGIFELLRIDEHVRQLIAKGIDAHTINSTAAKHGMRTLLSDGIEKVLSGITTLEEVLRVTQKDYADIQL